MKEYFGPGGLLSKTLPGYEYRPEQIQMAEAVERVLRRGGRLVVEAGTGIGKTLAYLIPSILSGKRVVISTGTINLQDQIFQKDIPFLQKHIPVPVRCSMMKGRENYLCIRRFSNFTRSPGMWDDAVSRQVRKIQTWMKESGTGDRAELEGLPDDSPLWPEVNSRSELCRWQQCPVSDDCFIMRMRRRAAESDLIIVNHHLLFADLSVRETSYGAVLPPYDAVVLDEAHLVEDIASGYFGQTVSSHRIEDLLRDTVRETAHAGIPPKDVHPAVERCQGEAERFFDYFMESGEERFRITAELKEKYRDAWSSLLTSLDHLGTVLESVPQPTEEIKGCAQRFFEAREDLHFIGELEKDDFVYWAERRRKGAFLWASPIDVSSILRERFFPRMESVVFTSATLATNRNFDYFKKRLGIEETEELILDSPFDYRSQSAIYLPENLPDPRADGFPRAVGEEILKILERSRGRAFLLFTSYRNLEEVYNLIAHKIPYRVLKQGDHPRPVLLKTFTEDVHSVLFGTGSFWQGVDVQGEALSCVVVDKLPFASPGDPLVGARIDWIARNGGNPFLDYQVPSAVLQLKQGFGRLIRNKTDRGILSVLDRRIRSMAYGRIFLSSLPQSPVVTRLEEIPIQF